MTNNEVDYSIPMIGTVIDFNIKNRQLAVYIPKLMQALSPMSYIWIDARNYDEPLPDVDSKVLINFIDGDPKSPVWEKFNYLDQNKIINDEKNKKLFTLIYKGKTITVKENDVINLDEIK